jgi:uncharacterized protein Smg (DUF494 family)
MEVLMFQRMLTIIGIISQYILEEIDVFDSEEEIGEDLISLGFEPVEIEAAFTWLANLSGGGQPSHEPLLSQMHGDYIRIFTAEEKRMLSNAARGYLLRLYNLDLVDAPMLEEIIDQTMLLDTNGIDVDDIKMISAMVAMFSATEQEDRQRLLHYLETDSDMLYH